MATGNSIIPRYEQGSILTVASKIKSGKLREAGKVETEPCQVQTSTYGVSMSASHSFIEAQFHLLNSGYSLYKNALTIPVPLTTSRYLWDGTEEFTINNNLFREFLFHALLALLARSDTAMPSKVAENSSLCQKKSLRFLCCSMYPFISNPSIKSQIMQTLRPNLREIFFWVLDFTLMLSINLSSYRSIIDLPSESLLWQPSSQSSLELQLPLLSDIQIA